MLTNKQINKLIDNGKMIYCFDIDDTILDFETHKPIGKMWDLIAHINKKFFEGNYILIFTSRKKDKEYFTINQLNKYGIRYNEIKFNKPKYHIMVDDSVINSLDYMKNPEFYDMIYKRYGNFINWIVRKRGI